MERLCRELRTLTSWKNGAGMIDINYEHVMWGAVVMCSENCGLNSLAAILKHE